MRRLASLRRLGPRLALLTTLAACGGGGDPVDPPPPPAPTPSALVAAAGSTPQTATVGTAVAAVPAVRVTSSAGQPVSGVAVAFAVTAGGGTLGAASATTNADGIASAGSWTLGTTAGANAVRATVGSLTPVTFEATGRAGPAARVEAIGAGQSAAVATAVPTAPGVKVVDAHGNAVSGVAVTFAVASGGGTVATTSATTGADGVASAGAWTLGTTPGANVLTATAGALAPVTLTANAQTGPAAQLRVVSGGDQRAVVGATLPAPIVVEVQDGQGNLVAGAPVRFQIWTGGGSLAATEATSDAEGRATSGAWTLGGLVGGQSVLATIAGHDGIAINALVDAGPPAKLELVGGGQTGTVAMLLPVRPTATVRDAFDNPLSGVTVRFTPSAGTVARSEWTTDGTGLVETLGWTLGTVAGSQTVDVAVVGTSLTGRISATATAGAPSSIVLVSGGGQTGDAAQPLPTPIVVRATDAYGNAAATATVAFVVTQGGGSATPNPATTDAAGEARTTWTLGATTGANSLRAELVGVAGATVTLDATATPAALANVESVDVANDVACARKSDGTISCWGRNDTRQIGDGTTTQRAEATPVAAPGLTFGSVSVGLQVSCALTSSGSAHCWGSNMFGSLGTGDGIAHAAPAEVSGGNSYTAIAAGGIHVCALDDTQRAWCWGANGQREVQPTATGSYATPIRIEFASFREIVTGGNHTCGIATSDETYCWGRAAAGQLGHGDSTTTGNPHLVLGGHAFTRLAAGSDFTCGLIADGTAYCWGANEYGQLGDGTTTPRARPAVAAAGIRFDALETADRTVCGVADGVAWCWGYNWNGQLGNGTTSTGATATPQRVATPAGVVWRSVHPEKMSCGVTTAGAVYCWGQNGSGLGDGNTTSSLTPIRVRGR